MLDPRFYRAGLVPVLFAIVIAAFSLQNPPRAAISTLAPDAFDGAQAFRSLQALATRFPHRRPGSDGDTRLAAVVEGALRSDGFRVRTREPSGETIDGNRTLRTVVGIRAGLTNRRIVVLAHRDAAASPATADLSGTAGLLELARVFQGRRLHKTLALVSTSGGSAGAVGAQDWAHHAGGPVDAVIVLGDLAGSRPRPPLVVPWSNGQQLAPLLLRRTLEQAMRVEIGRRPGETRGLAQLARLAVPLTVGEQGEVGDHGLPAALVSVAGERGPGAATAVSSERLQAFGRAVLRSISALDTVSGPLARPRAELLIRTKVIPAWAIRLLGGALILPVLFVAIDGFARARRRRERVGMWLAWAFSSALPFLVAIAFALVLKATALIPAAPPAPSPVGAVPLDSNARIALAATALVLVLGWAVVRRLALRAAGIRGPRDAPGAAVAAIMALCLLTVVVWLRNPFAALLLIPALHGWCWLVAPDARTGRLRTGLIGAVTIAPFLTLVIADARQLGAGPLDFAWAVLLLLVGGHTGPLAVLGWSLLFGLAGCVFSIVRTRRGNDAGAKVHTPVTRGPAGYAGPGSLGGTDSALRR